LQCFDIDDPRVYSPVVVDQLIQPLGGHMQATLQICTYGQQFDTMLVIVTR
jgi:hypothetical protein